MKIHGAIGISTFFQLFLGEFFRRGWTIPEVPRDMQTAGDFRRIFHQAWVKFVLFWDDRRPEMDGSKTLMEVHRLKV